ncbi:MAG TPA: serine/threonine-protein kinase, partial [Planctomycetota bacterium]
MAERRCPFCGEPAEPGHTGCAGLFREVMTAHPAPRPEELPAEVAPHAADPSRVVRQYVLVEPAGRGGMGIVWKAWDRRLARWVAVKFLHGPLANDAARFEREARLAAKLNHPNIASVIELGDVPSDKPGEPPVRFLALAFVDGPPLSAAELAPLEAAAVFAKVARAVDAAHRAGIVHRDLKPGNILLSRDGWPYVTDFGLARTIDAPGSLTSSGSVLGTPAFMAPEQTEGAPADFRSDVYALGASLYAVLCGRPPFQAESVLAILSLVQRAQPDPPRSVRPKIPAALEAVVLRAMRKAPEERYASAAAFADDLDRLLAGRPLERHPRKVPLAVLWLVL